MHLAIFIGPESRLVWATLSYNVKTAFPMELGRAQKRK